MSRDCKIMLPPYARQSSIFAAHGIYTIKERTGIIMITRTQLAQTLSCAMSTGADFAEVFVEYTRANSIVMRRGKVVEISRHDR